VQAQVLSLLREIRERFGTAVILVTHDLGVIAGRTERVAVMYGGRIIEQAATSTVFAEPRHPYTEALFDALPEMAGSSARSLYSIPGRPPDLTEESSGCSFAPRCRYVSEWCQGHVPVLDGEYPGHTYACFFPVGASGDQENRVRRPVSAWAADSSISAPQSESQPAGNSLLSVSGLVKDYSVTAGLLRRKVGSVSAVADVSFEVAPGQTFGLVGESGCGKTTIARLLVGLEQADAGSIVFGGLDWAAPRKLRRDRSGIQLMSRTPMRRWTRA